MAGHRGPGRLVSLRKCQRSVWRWAVGNFTAFILPDEDPVRALSSFSEASIAAGQSTN
jgi:hypothetical protein